MNQTPQLPLEKILQPIQRFIQQEKSGGIVLGISVMLALILANSPWAGVYHHFFEQKLGISLGDLGGLQMSLHHWINDGLMAIFFFVVGLELKREIVAGELSKPRKALLPIAAAIGGMVVPAGIYSLFNSGSAASGGWGIPMATDIAFALGVLYLLGNRIPLALKVFLTALAIVDDLGAVLVIALFYTADISLLHLGLGLGFLGLMFLGNKLGLRNVLFYALLGIGGVWTCFLLSGVHATIAAVLAAFTIPADVKIKEAVYLFRVQKLLKAFEQEDPNDEVSTLTNNQLHHLEHVVEETKHATPPLQRLEHTLHPFVSFFVVPVFALANAGVSFLNLDVATLFDGNVVYGVSLGLLVGKVLGIVLFTLLCIQFKIAQWPEGMNLKSLIGLGFLGAIGFTMSLFVTSLAFDNELMVTQAKIGIFVASILGGLVGFSILKNPNKQSA